MSQQSKNLSYNINEILSISVENLTSEQLEFLCLAANNAYRTSNDLILSDEQWDYVYLPELKKRLPKHELLMSVQPEDFILGAKGRIKHPSPMLSTDKAYTSDELQTYVNRCYNAAITLNKDPSSLLFKITPKLDGLSGRLSNDMLVTRGDGTYGNDVSNLLRDGLIVKGTPLYGKAIGEIVMSKTYFAEKLKDEYSDPRSFVVGLTKSSILNNYSNAAKNALKDGAIHLAIYKDLEDAITVNGEDLIENISLYEKRIKEKSIYQLDGVVVEVIDNSVKDFMGSTNHHNSWQIAKKTQGETADVVVSNVLWQIGRTGRCTPVIEIPKTRLSGAVISKITAHNARFILNGGIGKGAIIRIIRSGEVIPKWLKTIEKVHPTVPENCPCCGAELIWNNDFLECPNKMLCTAQAENSIIHHFKTIQCDLFGSKTVNKLVSNGFDNIEKIYKMSFSDFVGIGLGSGQSKNLMSELARVKQEPLHDYLLLASLGIGNLGRGSSKKLLSVLNISDIFSISTSDIKAINGFGNVTSRSIFISLNDSYDVLTFLLDQDFNLINTKDEIAQIQMNAVDSKLKGLHVVFTGTMEMGNRDEMKAFASNNGAIVQSSVNAKTDILICGQKVGEKKINTAKDKGVKILTEAEYIQHYL